MNPTDASRGAGLDLKARILDRVSAGAIQVWTPADFSDLGPRPAVDMALKRLVQSGELRRIARGLYDKPWTNTLTGKPSAPDVQATIDAVARRDGLRYVVDGMTAANALGLTDAVPAKTIIHTDARLQPIRLGNLEIEFKQVTGSKLVWAGRPAMRLVQALHWLKDLAARDDGRLMARIGRVLGKPVAGEAVREDLKSGFGLLPAWMQEKLRPMLFMRETWDHAGPAAKRIDGETDAAVRRFLSLIGDRYDIEDAILYGSRARGTHDAGSDADVALILRGDRPKGDRGSALDVALGMTDAAYDVLLETGINIAPLPVWLDEWDHPERHANPALLREISSEGVRL